MKKLVILVCVLGLLAIAATGAFASATNWVLLVKASSSAYTYAGTATTVGIGPVAATVNAAWSSTSGAAQTAEYSPGDTTYHSKHIVAVPPLLGEQCWDIKVGARMEYPNSTVRLSVWNTALDAGNRDTLLDTNRIYKLFLGSCDTGQLIAWWSTEVVINPYHLDVGLWSNVSTLMQAKGWNPGAAMTGWYVDVPVVKGAGFAELPSYALCSGDGMVDPPETPEPGSFLALASGLAGLAGLAVRRRRT